VNKFLRDLDRLNQDQRNFRIFGPDETLSNLLCAAFEATNRQWDAREVNNDEIPCTRRRRAGFDARRAPVRGLAGGLLMQKKPRRQLRIRMRMSQW